MNPQNNALFSADLWKPALEKYAGVTHTTVKLFDTNLRPLFGPIHPTPLFHMFEEIGYDPGIFAECANRCLRQTENRPAVIVSKVHGLGVIGTSLVLEGKIVGAAVAGYVLLDFSEASEVQRMARDAGVGFERLWRVAREQKPMPQGRLMVTGELLQVMGDALLRENSRTRQWKDTVLKLEETAKVEDAEHQVLQQTALALRESEERLAQELAATRQLQSASALLIQGSNGNGSVLYQKIVDAAVAIMRSDMASLQMFYPERGNEGELRLLGHSGFSPQAAEFWTWVRPGSATTCGVGLRSGQRVIAADVETCDFLTGTDDLDIYRDAGIRAVQSTPLVSRDGRMLGMISTHWRTPHTPAESDLRQFDILARQAADVLERKQAEEALRASKERLARELAATQELQSASALLIQGGNTGTLNQKIVDTAVAVMQSDMASMQTVDEDQDALRLLAFRGFEPEFGKVFELTFPHTKSSCSVARRVGHRVVVSDVETSDFIADTRALEDHRKVGIRAVQSTPLFSRDGRLLGMISTHWRTPHAPAESDLRLFDILARQAADLLERTQAEEALRKSHDDLERMVEQRTADLRKLSSNLLRAQDDERRRISRELHDSVGQYLAHAQMSLVALKRPEATDKETKALLELADDLDKCLSETRTISYLLHPPLLDEVGFASAARWYIAGFSKRSGIRVNLSIPDGMKRLPGGFELVFFRILQESLTNIHRHSRSHSVDIQVEFLAEGVVLQVRDHGQGMPAELLKHFRAGTTVGVGLQSMRERIGELGGRFEIQSDENGTLIKVTAPVSDTVAKSALAVGSASGG